MTTVFVRVPITHGEVRWLTIGLRVDRGAQAHGVGTLNYVSGTIMQEQHVVLQWCIAVVARPLASLRRGVAVFVFRTAGDAECK
jgi:hypothetical protein